MTYGGIITYKDAVSPDMAYQNASSQRANQGTVSFHMAYLDIASLHLANHDTVSFHLAYKDIASYWHDLSKYSFTSHGLSIYCFILTWLIMILFHFTWLIKILLHTDMLRILLQFTWLIKILLHTDMAYQDTASLHMAYQDTTSYCHGLSRLLSWGFTAQSTQWGHVERGQFT